MSNVLILDCETTGVDNKAQVIELGYLTVLSLEQERYALNKIKHFQNYHYDVGASVVVQQFKPSVEIHWRAYQVHGIGLSQLHNKPKSETIEVPLDGIDYIVGHNIQFDKRYLGLTNPALVDKLNSVKYICTLALAKAISKFAGVEYEGHSLDTLACHYYPDHISSLIDNKHNAKGDVIKTLLVLLKMVDHLPAIETWNDLFEFQIAMAKAKGTGTKTKGTGLSIEREQNA